MGKLLKNRLDLFSSSENFFFESFIFDLFVPHKLCEIFPWKLKTESSNYPFEGGFSKKERILKYYKKEFDYI